MVTIAYALLKEILMGMIGKIGGKIIIERFATRLVVYGLSKLKSQTTNEVVQETVDDVIAKLKGKKLRVIEETF